MRKYVDELKNNGQVAFIHHKVLYVIYESIVEEGYMIDMYDPFNLSDDVIDGGLCTGSAEDAVEFMI